MKDTTISYDIVQQQHQQAQQSWNPQHQRQQHQTHTTSVYGNHSTQRSNIGQQHAHSQLDQYHQQQQQLQSTTHQNSAYYQQASHIYPTYQQHGHTQDQQQQHPTNNESHHHSVSGAGSSSVVNSLGVVGSAPNQHHVHHQQGINNTQASTINHAGWSTPGINSITPQTHHAVVTDHSTLAYMAHGYQNHAASLSDHHRNTQPIGSGPQGSTYTVDSLYNTQGSAAAVAAAAAAYGYNNYNATFFQAPNNNPQTNPISTFWNHNPPAPQQQRANHSQAVPNQQSLQHRQPIASEQTSNSYIHDPLLYYGRPPYGQNLQNFGQNQSQGQADVLHQRMTAALSQQLLQHHEQQLHQVASQQHQQLQQPHQSHIGAQQSSDLTEALMLQSTGSFQHTQNRQLSNSDSPPVRGQLQINRQLQQLTLDNQQKPSTIDLENIPRPIQPDINVDTSQQKQNSITMALSKDLNISAKQTVSSSTKESSQQITNSQSVPSKQVTINKPNVIKNEPIQYQRKTQEATNRSNYYRDTQDDRKKTQDPEPSMKSEVETKESRMIQEPKNRVSQSTSKSQESDKINLVEDSLISITISDNSPRKTTWASIASQPAKVTQIKSLKSKIAGSNSVLSSAKHLAAVSLDTSSIESKNGINPAIKSSVSAATSSIQSRSSVPPPIAKLPAVAASLKLDLLGKDSDTTKISWPAVNAAINLKLDDPPLQKETVSNDSPSISNSSDRQRRENDDYRPRDRMYNDPHNNNNSRLMNSHGGRDSHWSRRDNRDERARRTSSDGDHHDFDHTIRRSGDNERSNGMGSRMNQFRGDDRDQYRERDRDFGKLRINRNEIRNNDNFPNQRFHNSRFESRGNQQNNNVNIRQQHNDGHQQSQNHHYNNVKDANTTSNSPSKKDLTLYPQLDPSNFNPKSFDVEPKDARYFVIKSYSEDDIHKSIKYSIWCSTNHGNKRLDEAYRQQQQRTKDGPIYLFFSVNGSGHFCGMAQMMSSVDFDSSSGVWAQSKWQGEFSVKWIFVKDVPNSALRHITLENNEDKPVTNSRDTQEVLSEKGKAVLKILHQYQHTTSLFDDFLHYERRQEEEKLKKTTAVDQQPVSNNLHFDDRGRGSNGRPYVFSRPHNEFQNIRDRSSRFAS